VRLADPARGQALAGHRGDDLLDVLTPDGPDLPVPDRRVHVPAQDRPVADDGAVRAEVVIKPRLGFRAEGDAPGAGVDEDAGLLVVLDLEQEVLGLAQVAAEGLLPLPACPRGRLAYGSGLSTGAGSCPDRRSRSA
jgi:hypothetical protein